MFQWSLDGGLRFIAIFGPCIRPWGNFSGSLLLIVFFFQDLLAGTKFKTIQISHARTTEEEQEHRKIRPFFNKEGNEICVNLL